jgi:hypothetical protein
MIRRINYKSTIDVFEFINRVKDKYEDMYITENKERIFLNKLKVIDKILKTQEVYVLEEKEIKGILLIYQSKGFRPYIKLLAESNKYYYDFMIFLRFNFMDKDLFAKLKNNNPLVWILQKKGFINIGLRGKEVLLHKKAEKILYKFVAKDEYLPDDEHRLY